MVRAWAFASAPAFMVCTMPKAAVVESPSVIARAVRAGAEAITVSAAVVVEPPSNASAMAAPAIRKFLEPFLKNGQS